MSATTELHVYQGLDHDLTLQGPGISTLDLSLYDAVRFSVAGLGISKTSTASEVDVAADGESAVVHLSVGDLAAAALPGRHEYQLHGLVGARWLPLTEPAPFNVAASA